MERSISRYKKIAPFSLNLEEMKNLCSELYKEFDNPSDVDISVNVELPGGVNLRFESIEEMMSYPSLPDVINEYGIRMKDLKQEFSLDYPGFLSSKASISARSEKEVWCAGMIQTATSALRKHRVWHYWIPRNPILWASVGFFLILYLFFLGSFSGWHTFLKQISSPLGWGCTAMIIICGIFVFRAPNRIFPTGAIRVKNKEDFLNRHSVKAMLLFGLIAAIGAIVTVINFIKS